MMMNHSADGVKMGSPKPGYSPDYEPQRRAYHQRARRAIELEGRPLLCEICGSNIQLEIHHINRDVVDNSLDNLQVLCRPCHMELHGHESAPEHWGPS